MNYPAKILLFGEHTILRGSRALARTYPALSAQWAWDTTADQYQLPEFAEYLLDHCKAEMDATAFQHDLGQGLYFRSHIPVGYGLGSSGALCAAVFDRYARPASRKRSLSELKRLFARMEQFFHGSSSGTDPLIIFLRQAVCLYPDGQVDRVELPSLPSPCQFFLLDTGQSRQTAPFVEFFTHHYDTQPDFQQRVDQNWIVPTEQAITACLNGEGEALWEAFCAISTFQFDHLPPMVLPSLRNDWQQGLSSTHFRLKICGAGGGGFCLGITRDWAATKEVLKHWPVNVI